MIESITDLSTKYLPGDLVVVKDIEITDLFLERDKENKILDLFLRNKGCVGEVGGLDNFRGFDSYHFWTSYAYCDSHEPAEEKEILKRYSGSYVMVRLPYNPWRLLNNQEVPFWFITLEKYIEPLFTK